MNRKISSKFLMLALAVGVFGITATNVLGQTSSPTTQTVVSNVAPSFTALQDDSDGTTPTDEDSDTTWTFTIHDDNLDDMYVILCSTSAYTAGTAGGGAPTCTNDTYATSALLTPDGSGNVTGSTLTRTALQADAESKDWYAIVCDDNAGGRLCGTVSQGTGTNDSPFKVNHRPTFASWTVDDVTNITGNNGVDGTDGQIEPGETVEVTITITDNDVDTASDTVQLYVCEDGDGFADGVCDSKKYCNSSAAAPGSHSCQFAASESAVPTAHGTYNVDVYAIDSHNLESDTTIDQTWSVNDVEPYVVDANAYSVSNITLTSGASTAKTYTVTVKDDNGDTDLVDTTTGYLYDKDTITLSSGTCTADENDCYADSNCALSGNTDYTTRGSGVAADYEATATCDFTVYFCANDSVGGANEWRLHVNPIDGTTTVTGESDSNAISVNELWALGTTQSSIAYGTVAIGGTSSEQTTTVENLGNQIIDVLIDGDDMCTDYPGCSAYTIDSTKQEWSQTLGFTYGGANSTDLINSASVGSGLPATGCSNLDLAVRLANNNTSTNENLYWKIEIPSAQQSGTYNGINYLVTTDSANCTGSF